MKFRFSLGAVVALALLPFFAVASGALAQAPKNITMTVGVCDPLYGARCVKPAVDGSITTNSGTPATGITPTNRTITSATGASQTLMAANASRHSLTIQNTGTANCGINPTGGTAIIGGAGTLTLTPTGSYTPRIPSLSAITAICTAGQPLYADEN